MKKIVMAHDRLTDEHLDVRSLCSFFPAAHTVAKAPFSPAFQRGSSESRSLLKNTLRLKSYIWTIEQLEETDNRSVCRLEFLVFGFSALTLVLGA